MTTNVYKTWETGMHGLHVAADKKLFKRVFSSIADNLLKHDGVLPHDWLEITIKVSRELPVRPKITRKDMAREFKKLKAFMKNRRRKCLNR
jgi:hypothetical protein